MTLEHNETCTETIPALETNSEVSYKKIGIAYNLSTFIISAWLIRRSVRGGEAKLSLRQELTRKIYGYGRDNETIRKCPGRSSLRWPGSSRRRSSAPLPMIGFVLVQRTRPG